jgi:hypothetical protein
MICKYKLNVSFNYKIRISQGNYNFMYYLLNFFSFYDIKYDFEV